MRAGSGSRCHACITTQHGYCLPSKARHAPPTKQQSGAHRKEAAHAGSLDYGLCSMQHILVHASLHGVSVCTWQVSTSTPPRLARKGDTCHPTFSSHNHHQVTTAFAHPQRQTSPGHTCTERMQTARGTLTTLLPSAAAAPAVNAVAPSLRSVRSRRKRLER